MQIEKRFIDVNKIRSDYSEIYLLTLLLMMPGIRPENVNSKGMWGKCTSFFPLSSKEKEDYSHFTIM